MKFSSKVVRNNLEKTSWKLQLGDMEMGYSGEFCKGYMKNNWLKWNSSEYHRGLKPISELIKEKRNKYNEILLIYQMAKYNKILLMYEISYELIC